MRGPPLRIPAPLHGRCALVGGPGRARGLYLRCGIDGRPCTALVDTGSTISLVRPGVFPGTTGALSGGWTATSVRLTTVTGQETGMRGRKRLAVRVGDREVMHEFWLADIWDSCIIGLDLLNRWGTRFHGSTTPWTTSGGLAGSAPWTCVAATGRWSWRPRPDIRLRSPSGRGCGSFRVIPFGLCNAPATFERMMERVLASIPRSRCVVYLDDLLVHARDFGGALANLREVPGAIRRAGLRLNPAKCSLLAREMLFLGHVVNEHGVATNPAKAAAVRDWPTPTNAGELWSFLGLAGYYRRFVQDFATVASPLHRLTEAGRPYVWDDACAMAFSRLQAVLTEAPVLAYPDAGRPFVLDTDASNVGVGAVLSQGVGEGERPVAYFSRTLSRAERNYCVTRRELLAVVLAVRHFRPYIWEAFPGPHRPCVPHVAPQF